MFNDTDYNVSDKDENIKPANDKNEERIEAEDDSSFEGKEKNNKNDKKKAVKFMVSILSIAVILASLQIIDLDGLINRILNKEIEPENHLFTLFYEPDYEIDILEDPEYLSLDRSVSYTAGHITRFDVDLSDFEGTGPLITYFDAMLRGDADLYNTSFSDAYFKEGGEKLEIFPDQRIYEISVKLLAEPHLFKENELMGKYTGIIQYKFEVSYKIQYNTGTVRRDIPSDKEDNYYADVAKPAVFEIFEYPDGRSKINSISMYYIKK